MTLSATITGSGSVLATDKYKMVMALAGFPLRRETFVLSLRRGGPFLLPVDPVRYVHSLVPRPPSDDELEYLAARGMHMDGAYRAAMASGQLVVRGLPKGSWFGAGEPVLTVTGPSALVSYLEAQVIWLRFRIQVATIAALTPERLASVVGVVTCEREKEIVLETLDAVGVSPDFDITVDEQGFSDFIHERAAKLLEIVEDPARVMEAGMRAVSCLEQHRLAVQAYRDAGFFATSDVIVARRLGMTPAGTTGHEHTQRWTSDYRAFTAVRDSIAGEVTFLLDTFSTRHSGLPTAIQVMLETPDRVCAIRLDSESTMEGDYLLAVHALRESGLEPPINLGGGFDDIKTRRFETLARFSEWPLAKQRYMYGQYLVQPHVPLPTRDAVSAVYKLSRTGSNATMKFSDHPGKSSLPGRPVVFRLEMSDSPRYADRPLSVIGQVGEDPPEGYVPLAAGDHHRQLSLEARQRLATTPTLSDATQSLIDRLSHARIEAIAAAAANDRTAA